MVMLTCRGMLVRRGILTIGIVGVVVLGAVVFRESDSMPVLFPTKTRGSLVSTYNSRRALRWRARVKCSKRLKQILAKTEGVESYQTIGGYGVVTNTYQPNYGSLFARLTPWEERHGEALHVKGIMAEAPDRVCGDSGRRDLSVQYPDTQRIWRRIRFQFSDSGSHRHNDCRATG